MIEPPGLLALLPLALLLACVSLIGLAGWFETRASRREFKQLRQDIAGDDDRLQRLSRVEELLARRAEADEESSILDLEKSIRESLPPELEPILDLPAGDPRERSS